MKAEKDKKTGKWLIQYRYTDWQGKRRKSTKRGFATKREAEEWLRNFLITQKADFDMKFEDFWKMYCADMETRLREHTMRTKKYIVELKILPYFGNKRVNDITAADIRQWQNYPDLYLPEETEYPIGKYGMLRKTYLEEHRKGLYLELVLAGKLNEHLHQVDEECNQMMDRLVEQMKEKQGVTEELKMQNQMAWVGRMNNIRACAEEIVLKKIVYA